MKPMNAREKRARNKERARREGINELIRALVEKFGPSTIADKIIHPTKLPYKPRADYLTCTVGEILRDDFMLPMGLTSEQIANAIPPSADNPTRNYAQEITRVALGDACGLLNIDLALALDRYFGLSPGYFWRIESSSLIREKKHELAAWLDRVTPRTSSLPTPKQPRPKSSPKPPPSA